MLLLSGAGIAQLVFAFPSFGIELAESGAGSTKPAGVGGVLWDPAPNHVRVVTRADVALLLDSCRRYGRLVGAKPTLAVALDSSGRTPPLRRRHNCSVGKCLRSQRSTPGPRVASHVKRRCVRCGGWMRPLPCVVLNELASLVW